MIRDKRGNWVVGKSSKVHTKSAISTEIFSLLQGLQLAVKFNITDLEISADCIEVINMINIGSLANFNSSSWGGPRSAMKEGRKKG